jgi:acyl-CoA thioesterase
MGMDLATDVTGAVKVTLELSDRLKQFYGYVHGGALSGLLDSCIAVAVNRQLDPGKGAYTVALDIHFLRPVSDGRLWGEGRVTQKGKRLVVGQGEIKDDQGKLVAFGTATFCLTGTASLRREEMLEENSP